MRGRQGERSICWSRSQCFQIYQLTDHCSAESQWLDNIHPQLFSCSKKTKSDGVEETLVLPEFSALNQDEIDCSWKKKIGDKRNKLKIPTLSSSCGAGFTIAAAALGEQTNLHLRTNGRTGPLWTQFMKIVLQFRIQFRKRSRLTFHCVPNVVVWQKRRRGPVRLKEHVRKTLTQCDLIFIDTTFA